MAEHYCEEHNTRFFKTAKMRAYAHPTEEKDENGKVVWCNEPDRVIKTVADLPGTKAPPEPLKPDKNKLMPYQEEIEARARNTALMQDSEFRNTALMQACEVAKNAQGAVTVNSLLLVADRFYRWLIKLPSDALELQISPVKAEIGVIAPTEKDETPITAEQLKHLTGLMKETELTPTALGKWMREQSWTTGKLTDIKQGQYNKILQAFEGGKP